ncbi:hypothetical protein [Microvirga tunisiensis]|uniref:Uncharacterized protein n=1 Tax=Microvirga tunisiensis TaxID=2108360 RepID=A0A5N7MSE0_9HYPH|nr:hypothetical protein [Microvirga tunisiensis]MPR11767.1 hypothetical protein [Microvirga tunisiensis]MPR29778.1 hypothetical protein [Microvirga tunisiensis]
MSEGATYVFEGTPEQRAYAAETIHSRVRAETRLTNGKAVLWWMGGAGLFLALLGIGTGAALWGYSRVADVTNTAEHLADTLRTVLEKVTVETNGEVKIANGQTVGLNPDATVAVEPGGTVRVEGGTVRAEGTIASRSDPAAPSPTQFHGSSAGTGNDANIVTNFTIFKTVNYGAGKVTTGWKFKSNEDTAPFNEYCYYVQLQSSGGGMVTVDLAEDGKMSPPSGTLAIDHGDAAKRCIWFNGGSTQSASLTTTTSSVPSSTPIPATLPSSSAPSPFASSSMSPPAAGASFSDWQNWCRTTYPATIHEWCLNTFGPRAKMMSPPASDAPTSLVSPAPSRVVNDPVPVGDGRLRMDPTKVKSF